MSNADHIASDIIPFDRTDRDLGVLIGFDGSEQARLALHYAAQTAQRSGTALTVVSAYTVPAPFYPTLSTIPLEPERVTRKRIAEEILDEARSILQDYPGEVAFRSETGDAAGVLVDLSASAVLAVVGARGRGGFMGRVLGSVSSALPAHAHCPTIVVPRHYSPPTAEHGGRFTPVGDSTPVVAGIDGSPQSQVAALHAAQMAVDRDAPLELVLTLPSPTGWSAWYPEHIPDAETMARRTAELEGELELEADWLRSRYPDVQASVTVEGEDPVVVLAAKSRTAQLTVVGTRGRGRVASALLGSVSRGLLHHAEGPVMVVPDLADPDLDRR